jgi:hypothetical protein
MNRQVYEIHGNVWEAYCEYRKVIQTLKLGYLTNLSHHTWSQQSYDLLSCVKIRKCLPHEHISQTRINHLIRSNLTHHTWSQQSYDLLSCVKIHKCLPHEHISHIYTSSRTDHTVETCSVFSNTHVCVVLGVNYVKVDCLNRLRRTSCLRLSLNRSRYGGRSTKYDTSAYIQVVCRWFRRGDCERSGS